MFRCQISQRFVYQNNHRHNLIKSALKSTSNLIHYPAQNAPNVTQANWNNFRPKFACISWTHLQNQINGEKRSHNTAEHVRSGHSLRTRQLKLSPCAVRVRRTSKRTISKRKLVGKQVWDFKSQLFNARDLRVAPEMCTCYWCSRVRPMSKLHMHSWHFLSFIVVMQLRFYQVQENVTKTNVSHDEHVASHSIAF